MPNLFLQPIVENAIRHGVARQMNEGVVAISARRDGGCASKCATTAPD